MSTHTSQASKAAKVSNPDGFSAERVKDLSSVLNALLADVFALYLKIQNFHWHMSGPPGFSLSRRDNRGEVGFFPA